MAQLLQPKQQLAGYEIIELVGKGGMGEVYRARQMSMDRTVALKVLAPRLVKQDPSFAKRFVDEAHAAGRLNNPNIIAVHDVGKEPIPGDPDGLEYDFFSMEFVDGESVKDFIERQGSLPLSLVVQIMTGMSEALVYAESQGIVHRDIKPDNIMITSDGTVKLADLGLALQLGDEEGVSSERDGVGRGKVMGTPLYMSPEQARALPVDHRSDQYSLGATLYHMLTGQPPFAGESAKAIMKAHVFEPVPDPKLHREVPEAWRALCMKLMAKNPDDRFSSCVALRAAVQAAIEGPAMPGNSRRVRSGVHAPAMPGWARMLIYGFAAAVVAMVLVNLDWGAFRRPNDGPQPPVVPSPVGADEALDRVRTVLKSLPPEPEKALAILQQCAADRSLQTDAAHRLLDAEIAKRKKEVEEHQHQQREQEQARQRLARLDEVKKAIGGGDLNQAKAGLQVLAAEADRLPPPAQERLKQLQGQFQAALAEAQKKARDRIAQAARREEVEAALNEAKGVPFPEAVMTALTEEAGKRQAALAKATTTPAPVADDKALWQALNENLEQLRGGFNYGEITSLAEKEAPRFANPQSREQVLALAELGRLATTAESALRSYLRENTPVIELQFRNKPTKVKLLNLDKDRLTFQLVDGGLETKLDRKDAALPLRELVDKALVDFLADRAADRPRTLAAMLWVWRAPEAKAAFAKLGDDPLARAVAGLESRARILSLRAPVVKKGKEVVVSYDFTSKNQALLGDFLGTGTALSEHGMAWTTTDSIKGGSGPETTLPMLCWKESLSPPLTITCQLWLRPLTQLALIGVMGGDQRIRAGFKNDKPMAHAVAALVTDENGNFKAEEGTLRSASFKTTEPVRVEITVDADYQVGIKYDDNLLLEGAQLPIGKPVTLIIQALQTKGQTTIELGNLKITGTIPER